MKRNYKELMVKLERRLSDFETFLPLERMKTEVTTIKLSLDLLRCQIQNEGFADKDEEVYFFKKIKPQLSSLLMLSTERYNYELDRPLGNDKDLKVFYSRQLEYVSKYFRKHEFLYQYYLLEGTELDLTYFIRGAEVPFIVSASLPELDATFSTVGEYLFSKFIALEKLREIILSEMQVPALAGLGIVKSKKGRDLHWTGDSCNLIELAYGIFDCKQINNGDMDLSDLIDVFEQCFQINLSRYFRRFTEIKRRKSMSRTRFIDEMRNALNKRIDDSNAYIPFSMRPSNSFSK